MESPQLDWSMLKQTSNFRYPKKELCEIQELWRTCLSRTTCTRHGLCCNTVNSKDENLTFFFPPLAMSLIFLRIFFPRSLPTLKWTYVGGHDRLNYREKNKVVDKIHTSYGKWYRITSRDVTPRTIRILSYFTKHFPKSSEDYRQTHESFRRFPKVTTAKKFENYPRSFNNQQIQLKGS